MLPMLKSRSGFLCLIHHDVMEQLLVLEYVSQCEFV
jgi:hypothetical protein